MFSSFVFWPWFTGLIFLIGGLILARKRVAQAAGLDKLVVCGPVFFAASMATFGAEHFVAAQFIKNGVPNWIPAHLFWAYFVGVALLCAALSIILMRYVRLSATLLGAMLFLFVILIHAPRVAAQPSDRFAWAVVLRDLCFGGAAWALAGSQNREWRPSAGLIAVGRFTMAIAMIFFGVEHFRHPTSLPGVPLAKMTPAWVPLTAFWGYLTGAVLLATGIALALKREDRMAATWAGLLITALVLFIYLSLWPLASNPTELTEATNYVADTLLFGGSTLIVAGACPRRRNAL